MRSDINSAFDEMVEALEENEDMVECKECFDLFPKAECEKSAVGFVCPTCKGRKVMPTRPAFEDPFDCYTQDFPEVSDYDPDSVVEYEVEPSLGDALDDLIKDEYDAINGYEVADEKIQHTPIPEKDKDEILDTLDHIKEEEEEHIDELKDLCPECEPEKEDTKENLTESAGEPKIYYIYADDLYVDDLGYMEAMDKDEVIREAEIRYGRKYHPEDLYVEEAEPDSLADLVPSDFIIPPKHFKFNEALTEAETPDLPEEESEENENEEVSDLESAYDAALEVANDKGVGQVFGYATEEDESFVAIDLFDVDDAEAVEDDLRAVYDNVKYAFVAYPEKKLDEVLHEGLFDIVAQKKLEKICPNGFKIVSLPRGAGAADGKAVPNMANGMKLAKAASKQVPTATWGIMISDKDRENLKNSDTTPENIKDVFAKSNWVVARFKNGKELENQISDILKNYKDIAKKNAKVDKLMGQADAGQTRAGKEQAKADARAQREREKQDAAQARADAAEQSDRERAELAAGDGETDTVTTPTDTTATSADLGSAGDTTTETTTETTSETETETTDTTETDTTETPGTTETPETPETPAAEPAEDTKKADQAKRIKDGFKTLGKDLSDEAVEKLRAILFAESYHSSLTEAMDPADFAGTWRSNLLFVYKAEDTSGANGFAVAFPKESGIRGYAAIAAEIAAGKYTDDSAKAYEEEINKFKNNLSLTPNTEGVTIDQWSEKCNAYFKAAEDLLKPATAPEAAAATPEATPEASGDTPEAPAAKAGKMSTQQMSQMRANQKKIYNAIVSDPELKDLAAKLYVDGTNKAGKKVKKATPELKALRKAIFGESFDAEVNEELQSEAEAVKSIKNTAALLQDTAKSMQNMTAAMKD
jgi:bacterioferritin (cytochrome b1)